MESSTIGHTIRSLRKIAGLSQRDLAEGICSQAQICKLENNNELPSSLLLNKLAKKLGVDMNYFFEILETPRLDYVMEVKELIRRFIRERDYKKVLDTISSEKQSFLFQSNENQQFLLWHEAICIHYIENKSYEALEQLYNALNLTYTHGKKFFQENEMEVLNSIAIIQKDLRQFEQAETTFREALKILNYLPKLNNKKIKIRLIYGLSKLLTDLKRYQESMVYCNEGILFCLTNETLYLFGEFQYQLGSNFARLGDYKSAKIAFNKAINIFDLQGNRHFINLVKKLRDELLGSDK